MSRPQKGKNFKRGLKFYSTLVAARYTTLERTQNEEETVPQCQLNLYIEENAATLINDKREQPTCLCCPENHLHVFRLPLMYFLIDDYASYIRPDIRNDRSGELLDIFNTLEKNKIYIYSTNNYKKEIGLDEMNLADKLIKLSEKDFDGQEFLRLVLRFMIVNLFLVNTLR